MNVKDVAVDCTLMMYLFLQNRYIFKKVYLSLILDLKLTSIFQTRKLQLFSTMTSFVLEELARKYNADHGVYLILNEKDSRRPEER